MACNQLLTIRQSLCTASGMSVTGCLQCDRLQRAAIAAAKAYHGLLVDSEATHIRRDSEATLLLSEPLAKALHDRDAAIAELTTHEHTHARQVLDYRTTT